MPNAFTSCFIPPYTFRTRGIFSRIDSNRLISDFNTKILSSVPIAKIKAIIKITSECGICCIISGLKFLMGSSQFITILHEKENMANVSVIGSRAINPFKKIFFIVPRIIYNSLTKKLNP